MTSHSRYSPSAAHRWMTCPASIGHSELADKLSAIQPQSKYAAEGTAAHAVAEHILRKNPAPRAALEVAVGREIAGVKVDAELARHLAVYFELVERLRVTQTGPYEEHIEHRIHVPIVSEHPLFGTVDYCMTAGDSVYIVDYKHGSGVVVEAADNPQLLLYAAGLITQELHTKVHVFIVQPRVYHPEGPVRSVSYTAEQVLKFRDEVAVAVHKIESGDVTEVMGEHCRWCKGAALCQANKELADRTIQSAFADVEEPINEPQEIAELLACEKQVLLFFDALKQRGLALALNGKEVPGHRLGTQRSNRKWVGDIEKIARALSAADCKPNEIWEKKKLCSPAKIEKLLKPEVWTGFAENCVTREVKGPTLVPNSSRLPVWTGEPVEFEEVEE